MIKPCKCEATPDGRHKAAEYQDKKYGKGNRVHNRNDKGSSCTVCGEAKGA